MGQDVYKMAIQYRTIFFTTMIIGEVLPLIWGKYLKPHLTVLYKYWVFCHLDLSNATYRQFSQKVSEAKEGRLGWQSTLYC
jgi:hypothetical protein